MKKENVKISKLFNQIKLFFLNKRIKGLLNKDFCGKVIVVINKGEQKRIDILETNLTNETERTEAVGIYEPSKAG